MTVDMSVAQSVAFLVISILLVIILIRILAMVHHQTRRVRELETRMKAMENMEVETKQPNTEENDG